MNIYILMRQDRLTDVARIHGVYATEELAKTVLTRCKGLDERHFYYIDDNWTVKNDLE